MFHGILLDLNYKRHIAKFKDGIQIFLSKHAAGEVYRQNGRAYETFQIKQS